MPLVTMFFLIQVAPAGQRVQSERVEVAVPAYNPAVAGEVRLALDLLEREAQTSTAGIGFEAGLVFFIEQGARATNALDLGLVAKRSGCEEVCLVTALHSAAVLTENGSQPSAAVSMVGACIEHVATTFSDGDAAGNAFMLNVELGPLLAASI